MRENDLILISRGGEGESDGHFRSRWELFENLKLKHYKGEYSRGAFIIFFPSLRDQSFQFEHKSFIILFYFYFVGNGRSKNKKYFKMYRWLAGCFVKRFTSVRFHGESVFCWAKDIVVILKKRFHWYQKRLEMLWFGFYSGFTEKKKKILIPYWE